MSPLTQTSGALLAFVGTLGGFEVSGLCHQYKYTFAPILHHRHAQVEVKLHILDRRFMQMHPL